MRTCDICKKVIPLDFKPFKSPMLEDEFILKVRFDCCQECYDRNYNKLEKRPLDFLYQRKVSEVLQK